MRAGRQRWTAAVVLLLAASGCSGPDVTADESVSGRRVSASSGDVVDIVLPADYETSNCQWHDKQTNDWKILRPLGFRYEHRRALPGHPGAGTLTGRFQAVNAGTTTVTLVREDNANPPKVVSRYTVDVTVN